MFVVYRRANLGHLEKVEMIQLVKNLPAFVGVYYRIHKKISELLYFRNIHTHKHLSFYEEQDRPNFSLHISTASFTYLQTVLGVLYSKFRQVYNSLIFLSFRRNSLIIKRTDQYIISKGSDIF